MVHISQHISQLQDTEANVFEKVDAILLLQSSVSSWSSAEYILSTQST